MQRLRLGLIALLALAMTAGPSWAQDGVSPDTFFVATGGDDGHVYKSGVAWPPTSAANANAMNTYLDLGQHTLSGGTYYIFVDLIRWDTSALVDTVVVTSATVRFYCDVLSDTDNRNITADYYSAWPIDTGDYVATPQTGAITAYDLSNFASASWEEIPLENVSNVSLTGYTGLRFHNDNSASAPTGLNRARGAPYEAGAGTIPQLIIAWTSPATGPSSFTFGSIGNVVAKNGIPINTIGALNGLP